MKSAFLIEKKGPRAGTERTTATVANGLAARGFALKDFQMRAQTLTLMRAIRVHVLRPARMS